MTQRFPPPPDTPLGEPKKRFDETFSAEGLILEYLKGHTMTEPTRRISAFGGDVRCLGEWRFEGGGFVQILVGGEVKTEVALQYVETIVDWKRDELARIAGKVPDKTSAAT